ncbi:hypothetical protein OC834_007533 [Tilletia horrida]|nr:hypothetical protein OC834_007533 [Tilletia horrida]
MRAARALGLSASEHGHAPGRRHRLGSLPHALDSVAHKAQCTGARQRRPSAPASAVGATDPRSTDIGLRRGAASTENGKTSPPRVERQLDGERRAEAHTSAASRIKTRRSTASRRRAAAAQDRAAAAPTAIGGQQRLGDSRIARHKGWQTTEERHKAPRSAITRDGKGTSVPAGQASLPGPGSFTALDFAGGIGDAGAALLRASRTRSDERRAAS